MPHEVTTLDRFQVIKMLLDGKPDAYVSAANPHLTGEQLRLIYSSHGYPDTEAMTRARNMLSAKLNVEQSIAGSQEPVDDEPPARAVEHAAAAVTPEPPRPSTPAAPPPGGRVKALGGLAEIPLDQVHPSPANPREHLTDIPELAASIREAGLIQPIVVQRLESGDFQIVAGHRRWAAFKLLGRPVIPALVRKRMLPDAELLAMLVENGQRAGLDPIEEARALKHLKVQAHLSDGDLARKVGRSQPIVSARIALLSLSAEEQEQIRSGAMTIGEGVDKGRLASGKVRVKGKASASYLSHTHQLATRARARCHRLGHKRGGGASVGGTACGECWESVIRADERDHLHSLSALNEQCVLCSTPIATGTL